MKTIGIMVVLALCSAIAAEAPAMSKTSGLSATSSAAMLRNSR